MFPCYIHSMDELRKRSTSRRIYSYGSMAAWSANGVREEERVEPERVEKRLEGKAKEFCRESLGMLQVLDQVQDFSHPLCLSQQSTGSGTSLTHLVDIPLLTL
ncbi:hypothetical protein ATANTOWER_010518 [Ataeniobius toweri]|uniref:Uncharacterized protein n=1 Tax=Ataeniobius toweri TaxID=208326 RepID=A0ABU7AQR0_9TELE|nr:hypothetical protein [Ataeniobius toweri]